MLNNEILAWSEYKIGREVEYNGMEFYVIKDSGSKETSVYLLKKEPLTAQEISTYSKGTGAITYSNGGMQYGETSDYSTSYVKQTVDAWASEKVPAATEVRLITIDELSSFGYEYVEEGTSKQYINTESTPIWLYNSSYMYLTMNPWNDLNSSVWCFYENGIVAQCGVLINYYVVRPVIVLFKTVLGDKDESVIEEDVNDKENNVEDNKINNTNIVDNTYLSQSLIIIILGFIIGCASLTLYYIIIKKEGK